jgi:hypothetical protein
MSVSMSLNDDVKSISAADAYGHLLLVRVRNILCFSIIERLRYLALLSAKRLPHQLYLTYLLYCLMPEKMRLTSSPPILFWINNAIRLSRYLTSRSRTKFFLLCAEIRDLRSRRRF